MEKLNDSSTSTSTCSANAVNKGATSTGEVLRAGELSEREERWPGSSLIGWKQALPLGMLKDGVVAEVVLVWGLDAEGPLSSHASHRLAHVERPHVLDLGQTDVQRTKGSYTGEELLKRRDWKKKKDQEMKNNFLGKLDCAGRHLVQKVVLVILETTFFSSKRPHKLIPHN